MQKLKSFWRSTPSQSVQSQLKQQSSILQHATNFISLYRKSQIVLSTSDFEQYLNSIPEEYKKFKKNQLQRRGSVPKKNTFQSIKTQLIRKVYQNVSEQYFNKNFTITQQFFPGTKKANRQKQMQIHQNLDQVQVALFNQITARFDQILSALRTVQSLQCLVDYNINRIKQVRQNTIKNTKNVANKQIKIVRLAKKRDNLNIFIQNMKKMKLYTQFLKRQHAAKQQKFDKSSTSLIYQSIQNIKKQITYYSQFTCCSQLDTLIQSSQIDLKRSFSQNLNGLIYQYIVGRISLYHKSFWEKFRSNNILQEQNKKPADSMILDQSTIIQEDQIVIKEVKLTINQQNQNVILKSIVRGWTEGQYAVGGLKALVEKHIKQLNSQYNDDMRVFCLQFLKRNGIQISNPSLQDMLAQFTLNFFCKACSFYSTLFQNLIYKLCSITKKNIKFIIDASITYKQTTTQQNQQIPLTIQKKQKLTQMLDGLMNVFAFVCKSIIDKFKQMLEQLQIHQTSNLAQFKTFITIIQNMQYFFNTKIFDNFNELQCPIQSFLYQKFTQMKSLFPLNQLQSYKKAKLIQYLSKMHKNAVTVQLRQSLQTQIWQQSDIPTFYYDTLHYITTGESINLRSKFEVQLRTNRKQRLNDTKSKDQSEYYDTSVLMNSMMDSIYYQQSRMKNQVSKLASAFRIIRSEIQIQNQIYRVTSTLLLLLQIIEDYMLLKQFYPEIQDQISIKLTQTLRSYNSSSLQLIVHAGAVALGKIKKSITAKHLALSCSCLRFLLYIMSCIKKRIKINDFEKINKQVQDHMQLTLKKLQTILMSKILQSIPEIKMQSSPSKGTEQIVNYCRIVHGILIQFFKADVLKKVFHAQITKQYLNKISAIKIENKNQAQTLKDDVNFFFYQLRFLNHLIEGYKESNTLALNVVKTAFQSL